MELTRLSKDELLNSCVKAAEVFRKSELSIIDHIFEIDRRKLHLERGYSSLHEFCVKVLKFADSTTSNLIRSMRLVKELPKAKEKLESGALSITNAAKLQSFFETARKQKIEVSKIDLLEKVSNVSTRKCEQELVKIIPIVKYYEKEKPISKDKVRVEFSIDQEKLKKLREFFGNDLSLEDMFSKLIDQHQKPKTRASALKAQTVKTRYIPKVIRRAVKESSNNQCCYVDPKTGRRCESRKFLEYDHITPFSRGGSNCPNNLQLLCSNHNKYKGVRAFRFPLRM